MGNGQLLVVADTSTVFRGVLLCICISWVLVVHRGVGVLVVWWSASARSPFIA